MVWQGTVFAVAQIEATYILQRTKTYNIMGTIIIGFIVGTIGGMTGNALYDIICAKWLKIRERKEREEQKQEEKDS